MIKRRSNDAAITRLVSGQLLKQQEEWQLERRCFFPEAAMAKITEFMVTFVLTDDAPSAQVATTIR